MPRVVDASRPRVRVVVEVSEAAELLMSLTTLLGDHAPEDFDVGSERIAETIAEIPPDLLEQARELSVGNTAVAAALLGAVRETPAPRTVADFVAHLEEIGPRELLLTLLGYYTRGHHVAEPETIGRAADGDEAAAAELIAAAGKWEEKGQFIRGLLELGADAVHERFLDVIRRWNADVFEPQLDELRPLLESDAEEKRAMAHAMDPGDFVERATGGIQYTAPPEIHELVFFPSWWFRPWVLLTEHKNARIFGYPISHWQATAEEAVDLPELARLYKALGDEKRLALLRILRRGPIALSAAAREVGLSKSTAHHHLAILRHAGLVLIRDEEENSYSLRTERLREVDRLLERSL